MHSGYLQISKRVWLSLMQLLSPYIYCMQFCISSGCIITYSYRYTLMKTYILFKMFSDYSFTFSHDTIYRAITVHMNYIIVILYYFQRLYTLLWERYKHRYSLVSDWSNSTKNLHTGILPSQPLFTNALNKINIAVQIFLTKCNAILAE